MEILKKLMAEQNLTWVGKLPMSLNLPFICRMKEKFKEEYYKDWIKKQQLLGNIK